MLRRLGNLLIRRAVPPPRGDDIVQDLREEYEQYQRPGRGSLIASAWYARQVILTVLAMRPPRRRHRPGGPRFAPLQGLWDAALFLRRRPRLLLVAALLVGPCIGVNIAIFNVLDGMLFRSLPYPQSPRIVQLQQRTVDTGQVYGTVAFDEAAQARNVPGIEAVSAFWGSGEALFLDAGAHVRDLVSVQADEHFVNIFAPALPLGRGFTEDDVRGRRPVVMISHRLWTDHFGQRRDVIGTPLNVLGQPRDIVGVLPPDFLFPSFLTTRPLDLVLPYAASGSDRVMAAARVARGAHLPTVEQALNSRTEWLRASAPGTDIRVRGLADALFERHRPLLWLVFAGGVVVLLAAALNLGILLRAVNHERRADFGVRLALGAPRARLIWQVIAETWLLVCAASAAAGVACYLTFGALTRMLPQRVYQIMSHGFDARSWMFVALSVLVVTTVAAGVTLSSALRLSLTSSLNPSLLSPRVMARRYAPLIASQVALGVAVSMIATALLVTYLSKTASQLGFQPRGAFTIGAQIPRVHFRDPASHLRLRRALLEAARDAPGVAAAGASNGLPLSGIRPDRGLPEASTLPGAAVWYATPGYFAAAGVPLTGRDFSPVDADGAAVVSRRFADMVWRGEDPLGSIVALGPPLGNRVVTGIAGNVASGFDEIDEPAVYVAAPPDALLARLIVRPSDPSPSGTAALEAALQRVEPRVVVTLTPLERMLERHLAFPRFQAMLFSTMGGLTLLLAVTGTYIAARQSVTSRTREIGVCLGLGATYGRMQAGILRQQAGPVVWGAGLGLCVAFLSRNTIVTLVGTVAAPSLQLWLLTSGLFVTLALAATALAARRVLRIDPALLLRAE